MCSQLADLPIPKNPKDLTSCDDVAVPSLYKFFSIPLPYTVIHLIYRQSTQTQFWLKEQRK
ncbi:hypothetical protein L873DRAFT_1824474 [Choiromyces venosus 120613-1]|uniref:Uncharacterized protein n=1 Tax=Choiromyces venosus 120613-1 TaxID=1336337 RepID=A0A3N4IVY9_9PEZI|nr:hypothetical protein L873DRAFT_1824474 [Choiromyces venosus 120613-1]